MTEDILTPKIIKEIVRNPKLRRSLTSRSHYYFFHIYFQHYTTYPTAEFQKEIFELTEDESIKNLVIVAFRGSGKSTIMNLSYPIWAILGRQKKKFILIVGQTQQQSRQHLKNLKAELESNKILTNDLGPFQEQDNSWSSYSLSIPKYGAQIMAVSTEQSIRGIRNGPHRPDLIICDDIEDLTSTKTKEGRDKVDQFLRGEIMPAGDLHTRTIVIGNLLHEDSLIMRLKSGISEKLLDGVFKAYPLVNSKNKCLWSGKYSSNKELVAEKRKIGNEKAWQREYMLKIISDEDQLVQKEWIKYYDDLPSGGEGETSCEYTFAGVDLAISQKATADYTAMVTVKLYGEGDKKKIYILPNPTNKRLTSLETIEHIKNTADLFRGKSYKIYIEDVGYQRSMIEQLKDISLPVEGAPVHGQDKRARLATITHLIQAGKVLFPRKGTEDLIQQLVYFGVEKHDDLADAFAIAVSKANLHRPCRFFFVALS